MLQVEVVQTQQEVERLKRKFNELKKAIYQFAKLFSENGTRQLFKAMCIKKVVTSSENIAGVEIPLFEDIHFEPIKYSLFSTPFWWDSATLQVRELITWNQKIEFALKKKALLEEELRLVSIRVNLFEKILIPRTEANIKKIKVFLGDQQLSAVATSKVAKQKILKKQTQGA